MEIISVLNIEFRVQSVYYVGMHYACYKTVLEYSKINGTYVLIMARKLYDMQLIHNYRMGKHINNR